MLFPPSQIQPQNLRAMATRPVLFPRAHVQGQGPADVKTTQTKHVPAERVDERPAQPRRPTMPRDDGSYDVADLRAMAAELERQFAGYKLRHAERNGCSAHDVHDVAAAAACDDDASGGSRDEAEDVESGGGEVRGRMYEAYVRRRDERLRQGWRARMERKEAEVMAFWAQLELTGRAGGNSGGGSTTTDSGTVAGDDAGKTGRNEDDKKRSSDAALAPRRITGKKHARTKSFSSSSNTGKNHPDVGTRRALSQEPPPSQPQAAGDAIKERQARPTTKATATSRPRTSLRRKSSVKGHGSAKQTGPKLPRSLPRRACSGGLEDLGREVVLPSADAPGPVPRGYEQDDVHVKTPKASSPPPRPSTSIIGGGAGTADAQTASPDSSGRSEVVDAVPEGKHGVNDTEVKKRGDEEVVKADASSSPDKLGNPNGEITSDDSDIESNYVYIDNKDIVNEHATGVPETLAADSGALPEFSVKTNEDNAETTTPRAGVVTTEPATTNNAEETPARESSGDSSFSGTGSGRLGRSSRPSSAAPSCSSRDQSIERVLEADAALLRKKRAEKSPLKTPGSAGSRVSAGTTRSPRETPRGFKRFLSFGKKNRAREVTVIDCTSPSVSSSVADDDNSGGWLSAGSIKPRMGSSDAASDDTDRGYTTSPRACSLQSLVAASPAKSELSEIVPQVKSPKGHRSFFSFRSLNCGRG